MRGIKQKKSSIKEVILAKTDGRCARCGRNIALDKVTIEHFVPKYRGGEDDERNLLPLCKNCNKQKGSRLVDVEEYYPYLKSQYSLSAKEYSKEHASASSSDNT